MQLLATIFILIKIFYPSNDIKDIQKYNEAINEAMQQYCFLDIDYQLVANYEKSDLILYPRDFNLYYTDLLGVTYGTYLRNPKVYGIPNIRLNPRVLDKSLVYVLTHEVGHFLGLPHSLDPFSLMYEEFDGENTKLTRYDSLYLINIYKQQQIDPDHE